ncbi:hypothetical protein [Marinobacterium stanieri]|uniref:hypothetical protein n=1 Tax=Marinobacterium stanieri TaxID=49186 RepID=UPI0002557833|nr:hypothetical protein [Marinobacterium stanieri]
MTDQHINGQFLTGDVGDEQQHVSSSQTEVNHIADANKMVASYHPEPGTECLSRAVLNGQWCSWKPVVIRAYNQGEVWVQCPVTKESFICPVSAMEFRPTHELVPVSKGGELNKASWDDFVARLRHDCVGEGVHDHYTANAIFNVEERIYIYGIDLDYTDQVAVCVDDASYHSAQEYLESCDEEEREDLNSKAQLEYGSDFRDLSGYELHSMLNERDNYTVTGWDERWKYVNSHFTKDAAEHFIATNSHNYRKGLRVYVDSQYRCQEYNTIKEAILSGKLQFVEGEQA